MKTKLKPTNSFYDLYFSKKKIMILVPHQDDELFLCGTIISCMKNVEAEIFIVFATNGDYGNKFKRRYKEACNALNHYKIKKQNIIFLGYGDQWNTEYGHIYNAPCDSVVESKQGSKITYGVDFSYFEYGKHHEYTLNNYENDLYAVVSKIMPDIIFCNDLDWHPDHRCISLLMDRIMGKIKKNNLNYHPRYLKGFVYYMGWDGKMDYTSTNLLSTKKPFRYLSNDKRFLFGNPYFNWDNRIRFPVDIQLLNKEKNHLYKAIKEYRFSKYAMDYYKSCMNSDAVFWERNTDNVAYYAELTVSSGYKEYLRDCMIADSSNISNNRLMDLNSRVWYANKEDTRPMIKYEFKSEVSVDKIVIYRDTNSFGRIEANLLILTDDSRYSVIIGKWDLVKEVYLEDHNISTIKILFLEGHQIGFSEIELLKKQTRPYIKVLVGDDFVYHYYIDDECERLPLRLYLQDCKRKDCVFRIINADGVNAYTDDSSIVFKKNFKRCELLVFLKYNEKVYDSVVFEKKRKLF